VSAVADAPRGFARALESAAADSSGLERCLASLHRADFRSAAARSIRMRTYATTLLTIGAAAMISACDRSPPEPMSGVAMDRSPAATQPAAGASATGGARDTSVPPADSAVNVPPSAPPTAGTDTPRNPPLGDMTKQKETEQMPRALDGNNHSSPTTGSSPAR
jgi:hypothetical protein